MLFVGTPPIADAATLRLIYVDVPLFYYARRPLPSMLSRVLRFVYALPL